MPELSDVRLSRTEKWDNHEFDEYLLNIIYSSSVYKTSFIRKNAQYLKLAYMYAERSLIDTVLFIKLYIFMKLIEILNRC